MKIFKIKYFLCITVYFAGLFGSESWSQEPVRNTLNIQLISDQAHYELRISLAEVIFSDKSSRVQTRIKRRPCLETEIQSLLNNYSRLRTIQFAEFVDDRRLPIWIEDGKKRNVLPISEFYHFLGRIPLRMSNLDTVRKLQCKN